MTTTDDSFTAINNDESRQEFLFRMREFLRAGSDLCKAWNDGDWDADTEFGMPTIDAEGAPEHGQPLFPLSFDEWLTDMYAHYFKDE